MNLKLPTYREFMSSVKGKCRVPLVGVLPWDTLTPLAIYQSFSKKDYNFFFESVERGEKWGRYSFLGANPTTIFRSRGPKIEIIEGKKKHILFSDDPLSILKKWMQRYPSFRSHNHKLPRFVGGAVGMVSYDGVRNFESLPDKNPDSLANPDFHFMIPEILLVYDSLEQTLFIVFDALIDHKKNAKNVYEKGCRLIQKWARDLEKIRPESRKGTSQKIKWKSHLDAKAYAKKVNQVKEYVRAGDITQTVLSVRFESKASVKPLDVYRILRRLNPSPYMFLLKYPEYSLVGASPETMVRLEEGEVTVRPIAGTRPRGATLEEDLTLEKELLADEKERAEHIMLVDLGRNDVGRIAKPASVKVSNLMHVERYSHVMHIVSDVTAQIEKGHDAFDVLRATFPAGTLSGSPKIRAMEIIDELEEERRGFYGGCVGYFSFSGNMEFAITIRSALFQKGHVYVQAGAGLVYDSVPEKEYQECCNKAKAVMKAVEIAAGSEK